LNKRSGCVFIVLSLYSSLEIQKGVFINDAIVGFLLTIIVEKVETLNVDALGTECHLDNNLELDAA
jgi:hypothetical protein